MERTFHNGSETSQRVLQPFDMQKKGASIPYSLRDFCQPHFWLADEKHSFGRRKHNIKGDSDGHQTRMTAEWPKSYSRQFGGHQ